MTIYYCENDNGTTQIDETTYSVPSLYTTVTSLPLSSWTVYYADTVEMYRGYQFYIVLPDNVDVLNYRMAITCSDGMGVDEIDFPFHYKKGDYGVQELIATFPDPSVILTQNIIKVNVYARSGRGYPSNGTISVYIFEVESTINSTGYGFKFIRSDGTEVFGSNFKPFKILSSIKHAYNSLPETNFSNVGSVTAEAGQVPIVFQDGFGPGIRAYIGSYTYTETFFNLGIYRSGNTLYLRRTYISMSNSDWDPNDYVSVAESNAYPYNYHYVDYYSVGGRTYHMGVTISS